MRIVILFIQIDDVMVSFMLQADLKIIDCFIVFQIKFSSYS